MQNTIIKEFANDPRVFAAVFQQGGANGETREWLEVFWSSYFLRGGVIWDESGTVGGQLYGQPSTHLPFGRGFIIDQEGRVDLPYFGHQPAMAIARIHALLATSGIDGTERAVGVGRGDDPRVESSPNPFNPVTTISYRLESAARRVDVSILAASGRLVRALGRGMPATAGTHVLVWNGRDAAGHPAPSGTYYVRVSADGRARSRAITLVR